MRTGGGVRARSGFLALFLLALASRTDLAAQEGVRVLPIGAAPAPVAALLARGGEGGSLRIAASALPLSYRADAVELLLIVELDGAALLVGHPGGRLGLELHAYALATDGSVRSAISEGVAIDLRRRGEAVERDGIRWLGILSVPPEETTVRTFVRERHGGEFALREQRLALTPPDGNVPAFVAVAVSPQETWLEARSPGLSEEHRDALDAIGGPPTPLPVLPASGSGRLLAWFGGGPPAPVRARLSDLRGRDPVRLELSALGVAPAGPGVAVASYSARFPALTGAFELSLEGEGWKGRAEPRRVVLRERREVASWVRVPRVDLAAATSEPPPLRPAREALPTGAERRRIEEELFAAWHRWSVGDRGAAIAGRQAFEVALVSNDFGLLFDDPRRAIGLLELIERPLLDRLLAEEQGCLLPLAAFYDDLVAAHLGAGRLGLSRRAELVATGLLERLANAAREPEERALAAVALESLASDLIAAGAPGRSAELVRRSAGLVPDRPESWLAIARLEELAGHVSGAARALAKVLELEPGNREGRLRRARLDARAGSTERASAAYERLLSEPVADWVGIVAAQERVRTRLAAGEAEAVAAWLPKLVERWPDEPSLWLALAYSTERAGDRPASSAALEQALVADRGYSTAPRRRYAEPPVEMLRAGRSRVETETLARLPDLARALAAVEAE